MTASVQTHSSDNYHSSYPHGDREIAVESIDTKEGLLSLRQSWDALNARDRESGFFLSWGWIRKLFDMHPNRIRVLAARSTGTDSEYLAFFPIAYRIRWSGHHQKFQGILEPGGRPAYSELTGFLCDPNFEEPAIAAIAEFVRDLPWTRFSMRYEPTGRRCKALLKALPAGDFEGGFQNYRINQGTIDNLACPQVELPTTYDAYLESLSANTRQKIRRFSRRQLDSGAWHITQTTAATVDRDITILMDLWMKQWGTNKASSQARKSVGIYRQMLETCHELGSLHLPILWQDDVPLVAHGCVADAERGHIHFVLSGRNLDVAQQNGGLLLHCDSMRRAIENDFAVYDFGHGDEPYKANLGGVSKRLSYINVQRLSSEISENIDPEYMADPTRKIRSLIGNGDTGAARAACNQLLKIIEATEIKRPTSITTISNLEKQGHD